MDCEPIEYKLSHFVGWVNEGRVVVRARNGAVDGLSCRSQGWSDGRAIFGGLGLFRPIVQKVSSRNFDFEFVISLFSLCILGLQVVNIIWLCRGLYSNTAYMSLQWGLAYSLTA